MAVPSIQTSMNAGEISPELYGEVDLKKFSSAVTTGRNFIANYRGGLLSRGGLAFVGRCKQNPPYPPRPLSFQFSLDQGYIIEAGDNYFRFVYRGGYVLEPPVTITGVTQSNPCTIDVAGTPYANGDWVYITGVPGLPPYTYLVAGAGSGSFTITDLNANAIDSTGFPPYISGGTAARIYTISTPYLAIDLPYLKFSQTADVMSLTLSNPVTGNEYPPYDLTRLAAADWTLIETDFDAVILPPANCRGSATSQAPANGTCGTFNYVVTAVDSKGNESIASNICSVNGVDLEVEGGSNIITWNFVGNAQYYNVYRSPCAVGQTTVNSSGDITSRTFAVVPPGSVMGFVGSSYGTQFSDTASVADLQQTPPTHEDPFAPGQILAVQVTSQGSGLSALNYTIVTSTGMDFAGYALLDNMQLGGFIIENGGDLYQPGDTIVFNGAGFASGSIGFGSTNPSANDTITLNGQVITFVASPAGANQVQIGGALSTTLQNLQGVLAGSADAALIVANYAVDTVGGNLLITYRTAGTAGNAYTLAASSDISPGVSGSTLAGGSGSGYAGAAASGSLTFSINPTNGQNIVLDGVTWTFVTSGAGTDQTNLGITLAATLTQLQLDLTASANASIDLANYTVTATELLIAYKTIGTAGDSYTLNAGTTSGTVSAPTLTGGLAPSSIPAATLVVGPESGTYPGVNTYFQQRHFFANSLNDPDTFWATQVGLYNNMDVSVPTIATDAITDSPWTEQVNGIQWLVPMPGGLLALTGSRAWQLLGAGSYQLSSAPITPSSVEAQPQAFNGCSPTVPPIVIDHEVLYVEVLQTVVRDLSWNFWVNIYTGADLTVLSSHLFLFRKILQWTWARNPYKVVWCACDDGTMLALTYLKEQEVYGWTRCDTQGLVVGTASVTEPPVNAPYFIVERFPPGSGGGGIDTFVMEARENYDPTNAALMGANTPHLFSGADQSNFAVAFDAQFRLINYLTFVVPAADGHSNGHYTNALGYTLFDGSTGIIANGGAVNIFVNISPQVAQKNIDTDAVTINQTADPSVTIPARVGSVWPHVTALGTCSGIAVSGGGEVGMTAVGINDAGGTDLVDVKITNWGSVAPGSAVTFTVTGTATVGSTYNGTGSDGTWRWIGRDFNLGLALNNGPSLTSPYTHDFIVNGESCEIYHLRYSDDFAQIVAPALYAVQSTPEASPVSIPRGVDETWIYAIANRFPGQHLLLTPATITTAEMTASAKLFYVIWATNPFTSDEAVRLVFGTDGNVYLPSLYASSTKYAYRLTQYQPPVLGTYGANLPGTMTDVTGSLPAGLASDLANYTINTSGDAPNYTWQIPPLRLPATGSMAQIIKLLKEDLAAPTDYTQTLICCLYATLSGSPSYDYHSAFLSGYLDATLTPVGSIPTAGFALLDAVETNPWLEATDFVYDSSYLLGGDYTKRWLKLITHPIVGGVVQSSFQIVFAQHQYVSGSPPALLQFYNGASWDAAYGPYGAAISDANVVAASTLNGYGANDTTSGGLVSGEGWCYLDPMLVDPASDSFVAWGSGIATTVEASGLPFDNLFSLNSAFTNRAAFNTGTGTTDHIAPPFLRLSVTNSPVISGGAYEMDRMDNRLWQDIEDTYAVDSGVSNPMDEPEANLFANSTSGAVTFTADQSVFASTDVGRILRMGGGIATLSAYVSATSVSGTWNLAASPGVIGTPFAPVGDWTLATPVTVLYAPNLIGFTDLAGLADGVPIGMGTNFPLTVGPVPFGKIILPFPASDVKVGLPFTPQLQTVYANGPQVAQGSRKMIPAVTLRLAASGSCQYGTNQPDGGAQSPQQIAPAWTNMVPVDPLMSTGGQLPPPTYTSPGGQTVTQLWTGDIRVVGDQGAWISKGQVAVQQTLPLPLEVVAVLPESVSGDLAEDGYSAASPGRGPPARDEGQSQGGGGQPPSAWFTSGGPRI